MRDLVWTHSSHHLCTWHTRENHNKNWHEWGVRREREQESERESGRWAKERTLAGRATCRRLSFTQSKPRSSDFETHKRRWQNAQRFSRVWNLHSSGVVNSCSSCWLVLKRTVTVYYPTHTHTNTHTRSTALQSGWVQNAQKYITAFLHKYENCFSHCRVFYTLVLFGRVSLSICVCVGVCAWIRHKIQRINVKPFLCWHCQGKLCATKPNQVTKLTRKIERML